MGHGLGGTQNLEFSGTQPHSDWVLAPGWTARPQNLKAALDLASILDCLCNVQDRGGVRSTGLGEHEQFCVTRSYYKKRASSLCSSAPGQVSKLIC